MQILDVVTTQSVPYATERCESCYSPAWLVEDATDPDRPVLLCMDLFNKGCKERRILLCEAVS